MAVEVPKSVLAKLMADVDSHEQDGTMAMLTLVGSHAYGLATETSDYDFIGVYVPDVYNAIVGTPAETLTAHGDIDYTVHSVLKFIGLAAKGNPTALEALWLPPLAENELWRKLKYHRNVFVTQRALHQYRGYAAGQLARLKRLVGEANFDEPIPLVQQKLARHMMRILEQGITLSKTGEVIAQVEDPAALFRFAEGTVNEVAAAFEERFLDLTINEDFPAEADVRGMKSLVFNHYKKEMLENYVI